MRGLPPAVMLLCAGCAQALVEPDAAQDGPPPIDAALIDAATDAAVTPGFFVDDDAVDFAGGTLDEAVIESWGAIAPEARYTGGLRARAADAGAFTSAASATWAQVQTGTFTGAVANARRLTENWGTTRPAGLGLVGADDLVITYQGELYLEPGTWTFHVLADDHAFLELAQPGSTTFTRVASADWPSEATGTFVAAAAAWYPVRLAYAKQTGSAQLRVELTGPTEPVRAPVSRHRLRFAANDLTGMTVAAFDERRALGDHHSSIDQTAPAGVDWDTGLPPDLGLTSPDEFTVRWSGQLRVDVAGTYTLRYVSDDGQRAWLDDELLVDQLNGPGDTTSGPRDLEAGWHDLVVDVEEVSGPARALFGIASGPELVGPSLPVDRLRPVEGRHERYETGVDRTDRPIPDLGQVESVVDIDAPPGAKVLGVIASCTFDHTYHGDLEFRVIAPDGTTHLFSDNAGGSQAGIATVRFAGPSFNQASARGRWRMQVRDTFSLDSGTLLDFQITIHHQAGTPPIAASAAYESRVRDLGTMVTSYADFSWGARVPAGAAVRLYVRSADSAAAIADQPWSSALVDPMGGSPPVTARRYFQYRVELDSDGDASAIVDWVRLDLTQEVP